MLAHKSATREVGSMGKEAGITIFLGLVLIRLLSKSAIYLFLARHLSLSTPLSGLALGASLIMSS